MQGHFYQEGEVMSGRLSSGCSVCHHSSTNFTHSFETIQVVIQRPETLPCVIAAVRSTHQELQYQSNIDQCDLVIWRKIPLKHMSLDDASFVQSFLIFSLIC